MPSICVIIFAVAASGSPHIVKTGRHDFSLSWLKGEVRENLGDFRKSIQILTFLFPLSHQQICLFWLHGYYFMQAYTSPKEYVKSGYLVMLKQFLIFQVERKPGRLPKIDPNFNVSFPTIACSPTFHKNERSALWS
jgi:hypothetical protein